MKIKQQLTLDDIIDICGINFKGVKEAIIQIAMGIFSHWLLKNYEIYNGASTAWYNMYTCIGNLVKKENE